MDVVTCCGKSAQKAMNIATGYAKLALGVKNTWSSERRETCLACDEITYLSKAEYALWLSHNGLDIVENFAELERLSPLPKQPPGEGRVPFCCLCKCYILAKVLVRAEGCLLNKWPAKPVTVQNL